MFCFVPGCNSGYARNKRTCPLFRPPADPGLLRQWERNIQRKDRALTRKDVVCALHFEKHLVCDRYYSEHDGNVLLNERKVPRLRKGAVPTIFEGGVVGVAGAGSDASEGSSKTVAQPPPDAGAPLCDASLTRHASLETTPCLNADARSGDLDQRITVKREEEDSSDASLTWNTEPPRTDEKIVDPSVHPDLRVKVENEEYCLGVPSPKEVVHSENQGRVVPDLRVKVENEEYCLGVPSPKEVVHNENQGRVVRQLSEVEPNGAGVGCRVEVKKEEECTDEQCPLQVPKIVCVANDFDTPQAPRIVPRALVEHLVHHPEVVKLPPTWNYHKVRAPRGNRVVFCTLAVASDGTTPVVSKFVNVTDSREGEPLEAFVSSRSLDGALGDVAKPTSVEAVERMVEAIDRLPICSGGPPRAKYPDVDPTRARVDALGVWRHVDCEVYGAALCRHCARLDCTLRAQVSRQRRRKDSAPLRVCLASLPPVQRSKVELLRKRSRCLYKKLRRLTGGGKELWDDEDDGEDDENGIEYPEALS
ncbi:uncharacterized protein [Dermacentor andersoni]|uniref:uncharacterized protein n=1 Tax=Dermacentor andersoni TaxID=34620 RepID=UPI003B3B3BA1